MNKPRKQFPLHINGPTQQFPVKTAIGAALLAVVAGLITNGALGFFTNFPPETVRMFSALSAALIGGSVLWPLRPR